MSYRLKRPLDVALVVISAPLWVPVLFMAAVVVRVGLGRGVLFRQPRAGLHSQPFEMLKLRTMTDTRDQSGNLLPDQDRLPALGRFLRQTSLDELPGLLNVLRGDMSLVGPRPFLTQYVGRYSSHHQRRHDVRPGITGLAQVSGRNALSWDERLDLDVVYVDSCSLALDVRILYKTIAAVVFRTGISPAGEVTMPEFTGSAAPGSRGGENRS